MKGELFINGKDAYETWGMSLSDGAVSELLTPPPMKENIINSSRLEHGSRVLVNNPKIEARNLTLELHFVANNKDDFFTKYKSFCNELSSGIIDIKTKYSDDVYKCIYESCSQFSQFCFGIAKFALKLVEPNPTDRS